MPKDLDDALGHGEKLTALVRAAASNPHQDVQFHTSWDEMLGRPRPDGVPPPPDHWKQALDQLVERFPDREVSSPSRNAKGIDR